MPYLAQDRRDKFPQRFFDNVDEPSAGDLNYLFSIIIKEYIERRGERYAFYNDAIGALSCCSQEIYRRLVAGYEDKAIERSGDVF